MPLSIASIFRKAFEFREQGRHSRWCEEEMEYGNPAALKKNQCCGGVWGRWVAWYYSVAQPACAWSNIAFAAVGFVVLWVGTGDGARWSPEVTKVYGILNVALAFSSFLYHALPDGSEGGRLDELSMCWIVSFLLMTNVVILMHCEWNDDNQCVHSNTDGFDEWFWGVFVVLSLVWALLRCCKIFLASFGLMALGLVGTILAIDYRNGWVWGAVATFIAATGVWRLGRTDVTFVISRHPNACCCLRRVRLEQGMCRVDDGGSHQHESWFHTKSHVVQAHAIWHVCVATALLLLYFFYAQ